MSAAQDATALAELVRSGQASPVELVEAALERIDQAEPQLGAVVHRRDEEALAEARGPLPEGPFRGVPILLKDLWTASAGDPWHLGVAALRRAGHRSDHDSNLVRRYREAGFVFVGRTNTPELGLVATTEPLACGPTRNPWDVRLGAGGSSGGAAAAVAAGLVSVAGASDGGGSIRIPAALCGLVGLKPSRGRVSMGPAQEEWGLSVQHVITRTVRDSAAVLDATSQPFPGDGVVAPRPAASFLDAASAVPGPLRVGVLLDRPDVEVEPVCRERTEQVASTLEALGHQVAEAHPAALKRAREMGQVFLVVWSVNAALALETVGAMLGRAVTAEDVEPTTWALAELGRGHEAVELARAQAAAGGLRRDLASWWDRLDGAGWDILLTPTTARAAPVLGELACDADDPLHPLSRACPTPRSPPPGTSRDSLRSRFRRVSTTEASRWACSSSPPGGVRTCCCRLPPSSNRPTAGRSLRAGPPRSPVAFALRSVLGRTRSGHRSTCRWPTCEGP